MSFNVHVRHNPVQARTSVATVDMTHAQSFYIINLSFLAVKNAIVSDGYRLKCNDLYLYPKADIVAYRSSEWKIKLEVYDVESMEFISCNEE